jgi:hypothetical protein
LVLMLCMDCKIVQQKMLDAAHGLHRDCEL